MPRVKQRNPNEPFEVLMNRFKRAVDKADVLNDYYKHEFYEKPSRKRVRLKAAAVKRHRREVAEMNAQRGRF